MVGSSNTTLPKFEEKVHFHCKYHFYFFVKNKILLQKFEARGEGHEAERCC